MNYIFFTIQYNIGFRNKRNTYINLFPKQYCLIIDIIVCKDQRSNLQIIKKE
jgi:hypothetical protein